MTENLLGTIGETDLTSYLEYLDRLRESGITNMFGAGQYLRATFDLDYNTSEDVLLHWIKTYELRSDTEDPTH